MSKVDQHDMLLVLGDWSSDGHSQTTNFGIRTNKTVDDIQKAYKASCKMTGISFNHNEDYTEVARDWRVDKLYRIATEYDKPFTYQETYDILVDLDCPLVDNFIKGHYMYDGNDVYYFNEDDRFRHFIDLWLWFVQLSLPDLEYIMAQDIAIADPAFAAFDPPPPINGFWNEGLNVQFGYGLYCP